MPHRIDPVEWKAERTMVKRTRPDDGWAQVLGKIVELVKWIIQPSGPLARAALLILACTLVVVAAAVAVVFVALILLSR